MLDLHGARELELFIMNDYDLYKSRYVPISKNLDRKIRKGIYQYSLSVKLFKYLVDDGCKKYQKEFGGPSRGFFLNPETRRLVARSLAMDFATEYKNQNPDVEFEYEFDNQLIPSE